MEGQSALYWLFACALVLLAITIGLNGIDDLPVDRHEAFVLRTTQEMHNRGDWTVPYFNNEPRLNKPPLSYWLTGLTARLRNGSDLVIEPFDGRLPSLLAAVGTVFIILWLGTTLYGQRAGLWAGLLYVTCISFFGYTHDARPDMVYAFFSFAGLTSFTGAWRCDPGSRQQLMFVLFAWLTWTLATLTKGPHIPAMLLAACFLFAWLNRDQVKTVRRVLHPVAGIAVLLLLTLPWWLVVNQRLGGQGLEDTQLSGSLYALNGHGFLNLYYLYRPLQLFLPWTLLLPAAVVFACRHWRSQPETRLLVLAYAAAVLGLSLADQQRWYYMLPVLPVLALLTGAGIARWIESDTPGSRGMRRGVLYTLAGIVALLCITAGGSELPWGRERYERQRLARVLKDIDTGELPLLAAWPEVPGVYVYYAARPIHELTSTHAARKILAAAPRQTALSFMPREHVQELSGAFDVEILAQTEPATGVDEVLVRLSMKPDPG